MNSKSSEIINGRQRRMLLQGALAACSALALPTLAGCGKREEPPPPAPTSEMAPPPPPQAQVPSTTPSTPQVTKVSKAQAQYQEQPNGDQQCSTCQHFVAESNTCNLVEGQIAPNGWCRLWILKQV